MKYVQAWVKNRRAMVTRITTLVENTAGEHLALRNEHGLSFCVETSGKKIIFDCGQSGAFIKNAEQLRIDLHDVAFVVLSHGHYDHSGGLRSLVDITTSFELIVGKGFFKDKYADFNGRHEFLGNNFTESFLKDSRIRYSELADPVRQIVPGVYVMGGFPRVHADEVIKERFKLLEGDVFIPDHFDDEVMLVVDSPKGLVALLGCSHPGMRNMLEAAKTRFGKNIYAVIGGTHLVEAAPGNLGASLEYLHSTGIGIIGVSHCTGAGAMKTLGESEERYFHNRTGSALVI
jgi:7,8-dihydropterin-6-yl-methyl-4-(beta-D-ribofuranosyl)aminobenzene 5'-phosphate synthase